MIDDADSGTASAGPAWDRPPVGPPPQTDPAGPVSGTGVRSPSSPFRRHPLRWTVAAGGLAAVLALGGYGVTQAATSNAAASTTSAGVPGAGNATGGPPGSSGGSGGAGAGAPAGSASGGAPGRGSGTGGIVTAISGDTITLRSRSKTTVTVVATSSTVFKDGTTTVTASALKRGDLAMVVGPTSSNGTVTATTITFGNLPRGAPGTAPKPPGA